MVDSTSAISRFQSLRFNKTPARSYPDDADVISHVNWLWAQLSEFVHTLKWVKGHQDALDPLLRPSLELRLNIMADSLATEFYHSTTSSITRPHTNPLFFPTTRVSLTVNGQRVTANPSEAIRFHINGTNHRRYLQTTKPGWHNNKVWELHSTRGNWSSLQTTPSSKKKERQQDTPRVAEHWKTKTKTTEGFAISMPQMPSPE